VFKWFYLSSEGFLIIHVQKRQCLVGGKTAFVGKCNLTDPNQQWRWTEDEKLLHVRSGQCLGISKSSAASSRSIFIDCPRAPSWIFHNTEGLLQVANSSLFLTKQGPRVMIKMGRKYPHSWKQIDVDDKGKTAYENLCPHKGELFLSGSVLGVMVTILSLFPGNFLRSSKEIFIRNITENYSKNIHEKLHLNLKLSAVTEKSWIPTTTYHYFSTPEEAHGEPAKCARNLTEWRVSSQSVYLRWSSWGNLCNFTLTRSSDNASHTECHPVQKTNESYECSYSGLEAGTLYHLRIFSLSGTETSNISLQTDPLPPTKFEINKEKTTSTSLQVSWSPSSGKVDWYELQLSDHNNKKIQNVSIQGGISRREETFSNLIPGSKYNVIITAVAGNKSTPAIHISGSTVPSPVQNIQISVKTDTIHVSWLPGSGYVDRYRLLLLDKEGPVREINHEEHLLAYPFRGLTAGHLYNLTIIAEAAGLESYNFKLVRTAPAEVSDLMVTSDGSLDTLKVTWKRPLGNLDFYNITLSHLGSIKEIKTLQPRVTEAQFDKLIPGSLYQVTVSTISGELFTDKMATGRTVPQKVSELKASSGGWLRSLTVSWLPPAGDWERYYIVLFNLSAVLLNTTLTKDRREYVIQDRGLIPGRQYEVAVIVESGGLQNMARCKGRTAPQPVLQLRVKHANESSLSVMWMTPVAEWDSYVVSLGDRDLTVINKALVKEAKEYTFSDLVPGRKYTATVTSISGDLSNWTSVEGRTVPAQVTSLHVTNQGATNSLFTNWTRALGDVDSYQVLLIHENVVIKNESVSSETSRYHFHSLKAGGLYSVVVTTVSGGISSRQTIAEGRTVPSSVSGVTVNNSGRSDYLSISWLPATGDVDNYLVTLSHDSQTVQTLTISKALSECSFSSLVPGRLYNVTITTKSGKYENHSFSWERTGKGDRKRG
uniref:Fibronectin type-III domain-containing protein n=1 Tax=Chelydra serpentina TaxID=8475 RepID=A0A8C3RWH3_CHESE